MTRIVLTVPADHPAYAGHFPGAPMLPGAILLAATLEAIAAAEQRSAVRWRVPVVKFLGALRPGEPLELQFHRLENGAIRFQLDSRGRAVAEGTVRES
jgi:3-hydroxymyristoyl/3-hydroxydecanoyl-(acyl carrier protein) dehydratase